MCHMVCLALTQGWLYLGQSYIQLGGQWRRASDIQVVFSSENGFVYAGALLRKTKTKIDLYLWG